MAAAQPTEVRVKKTPEQLLAERVQHLKGLRSVSDQQALLVLLHDKPLRTEAESKRLTVLWRAEVAGMRASAARLKAANMLNAEDRAAKLKERKARDHELFQVAGLMGLAGLIDNATGLLLFGDKATLLGALMSLAATQREPQRMEAWRAKGQAKLAESAKASVGRAIKSANAMTQGDGNQVPQMAVEG